MSTKANITIDSGTTFSTTLTLTDENGDNLDLNGYTANSSMKKWYTSHTSIPFNVSINTTASTVTLEMDASVTSNLYPGRYVYDVDLTDSSNAVSRIVEGVVTVTPSVSSGIYSNSSNWSPYGYTG